MAEDFYDLIAYPGLAGGTFGDLSDVTVTTAAQGDVLYYNGSAWVNLATGTAGTPLLAGGAAADPYYATTAVINTINPTATLTVGGALSVTGAATASSTLTVTGLAVLNGGFETTGEGIVGGDLNVDGLIAVSAGNILYTDTISEQTLLNGVAVDGVSLKDGGIVCANGSTLEVDTVNEATAAAGVTVDSVLLKDGGATFSATITGTTGTFSGGVLVTAGASTFSDDVDIDSGGSLVVSGTGGIFCSGSSGLEVDVIKESSAAAGVTVDGLLIKDGKARPATTDVATTPYSALVTDSVLLVDDDTVAGSVTINLPAAATAGDGFRLDVKKLGTAGNVVIDGSGAETIDGAATQTLTLQYENLTVVCDGTAWHIL